MLVSDLIIALAKAEEAVPSVQLRVRASPGLDGDPPALRIDGTATGQMGQKLRIARLVTLQALESEADPEAYFLAQLWIVIAALEQRANPQRRRA